MTYRTLKEIQSLDKSNHTLRFNRSLRDVGWHGERRLTPAGRFWLGYVMLAAAVFFAVVFI